ncbi:MAG: hypothetical protein R2856_20900 [Caldilineaceae bacterium]
MTIRQRLNELHQRRACRIRHSGRLVNNQIAEADPLHTGRITKNNDRIIHNVCFQLAWPQRDPRCNAPTWPMASLPSDLAKTRTAAISTTGDLPDYRSDHPYRRRPG